jgi:hypothetical protein
VALLADGGICQGGAFKLPDADGNTPNSFKHQHAFQAPILSTMQYISLNKIHRVAETWPADCWTEFKFSPSEWVNTLLELRLTTRNNAQETLSDRSCEILHSLCSTSHAVETWDRAMAPDRDTVADFNARKLALIDGDAIAFRAEFSSEVEQKHGNHYLSQHGFARELHLKPLARVMFRVTDKRLRFIKGDEGVVEPNQDLEEIASTGGGVRIRTTDGVVIIKPVTRELPSGGTVSVMPLLLAWARTILMTRGLQKQCWPILLTRSFNGLLTFAEAQLYIATGRSVIPPPMQLSTRIDDPFSLRSSFSFGNAEAISFVQRLDQQQRQQERKEQDVNQIESPDEDAGGSVDSNEAMDLSP